MAEPQDLGPPPRAARFCQDVVVHAVWDQWAGTFDGNPYGITGYQTGGRGGKEHASWASFTDADGYSYSVHVECTRGPNGESFPDAYARLARISEQIDRLDQVKAMPAEPIRAPWWRRWLP